MGAVLVHSGSFRGQPVREPEGQSTQLIFFQIIGERWSNWLALSSARQTAGQKNQCSVAARITLFVDTVNQKNQVCQDSWSKTYGEKPGATEIKKRQFFFLSLRGGKIDCLSSSFLFCSSEKKNVDSQRPNAGELLACF